MPEYVELKVYGEPLPIYVAYPSQVVQDGEKHVTGALVNERGEIIQRGWRLRRRSIRSQRRAVMVEQRGQSVLVPV